MMGDGHLGKCKPCARRDVRLNRMSKRGQYQAYERERNRRPERRAAKLVYERSHRARHPGRARARAALAYAVRTGKVQRLPCRVCGSPRSEAHHRDYRKPLDVDWLCFKHHREHGHGQVTT